jgi:SAM-dependent methyltransferase
MEGVVRRLAARTEEQRARFQVGLDAFAARHGLSDWEGWFSPYDDQTYQSVLRNVQAQDRVLDLGAGDLRLSLLLAQRVQRVYAVEVNPLLVAAALAEIGLDLPRNLQVICANALDMTFPSDVTLGVLLMRHCQHFSLYWGRLQAAGCQRLITNARWMSGVEVIDLSAPRVPWQGVARGGWYACRCGAVGYVGGPVRAGRRPAGANGVECPHPASPVWSDADTQTEVGECPACQSAAHLTEGAEHET